MNTPTDYEHGSCNLASMVSETGVGSRYCEYNDVEGKASPVKTFLMIDARTLCMTNVSITIRV